MLIDWKIKPFFPPFTGRLTWGSCLFQPMFVYSLWLAPTAPETFRKWPGGGGVEGRGGANKVVETCLFDDEMGCEGC